MPRVHHQQVCSQWEAHSWLPPILQCRMPLSMSCQQFITLKLALAIGVLYNHQGPHVTWCCDSLLFSNQIIPVQENVTTNQHRAYFGMWHSPKHVNTILQTMLLPHLFQAHPLGPITTDYETYLHPHPPNVLIR
jgi:hypothetical protein